MQRRHFLSGSALLLAAVTITLPTVAQAAGSRTVPAASTVASAPTARSAAQAPGGLRLSLSTRMRDPAGPPRGAAAVATPSAQATLPMPARPNPYLPALARTEPAPQLFAPIRVVPAEMARTEIRPGLGALIGGLVPSIPLLPESGRSILPSVKKVYPTGEKPLVVVSFKCPTEVIGVTPPTIKALHDLVSLGMDGLNRTDLLSFNLQQVCQ